MKTTQQQRGVTWVETCVVLAILGVVSGAALPEMGKLLDARRLEGAAVQFATDVQFARSEAVARNQPVRLSVFAGPQSTCYALHTGQSNQCTCVDSGPAVCTGSAREIKSIALPASQGVTLAANTGSVLFDPLHGTSTPTATFRILGRRGQAIHQVINVMGRVRSCTPAGGVPGYPNC
ncbi:MAG: GspH/FimT family pseudopilin [Burkholderiaceae bacterium]